MALAGKKRPRKILTPLDFLQGQARRNYIMPGEVITVGNVYNDINNVPKLEELLQKDSETVKKILTETKKRHTNKVLTKHFQCSDGKLYSIYDKYGVEYNKKPRTPKDGATSRRSKSNNTEKQVEIKEVKEEQIVKQQSIKDNIYKEQLEENIKLLEEKEKLIQELLLEKHNRKNIDGFNITFKGSFNGNKIETRLLNVLSVLEKENIYKIEFKIEEIETIEIMPEKHIDEIVRRLTGADNLKEVALTSEEG